MFVDPQRVAAFTRSPPQNFEPKEGGKFSLFGGNVEGVFKVLEQNEKIVQSWRLGGWPKGKSWISRKTPHVLTSPIC